MVAWSSRSRITGTDFLPPLASLLKEGLAAFGPPRDGFGLLLGLLDGGEQHAGQGLDGKGVGPRDLDQLAKLHGLLSLELLGPIHDGLEFGVVVTRLACHDGALELVRRMGAA